MSNKITLDDVPIESLKQQLQDSFSTWKARSEMAGDWIKIEHCLPGKPEVMELARILSIDEMAVIGHLVCFWSWVDQNLSPDCPATNGTKKGLDRVSGREGFVDAMVEVGWLSFDGQQIRVPNYDHHLSQSAKKRGLEARKKQRQRKTSPDCPATNGTKNGHERDKGGDQRREEYLDGEPSLVSKRFSKPTISQLEAYALSVERPDFDAEAFMDYYESVGWTIGKNKPMKSWKGAVSTWLRRNKPKDRFSHWKLPLEEREAFVKREMFSP